MSNWKTTLFGMIAGAPQLLQAVGVMLPPRAALIVNALAMIALGWSAKDHNVTGGTTKQ